MGLEIMPVAVVSFIIIMLFFGMVIVNEIKIKKLMITSISEYAKTKNNVDFNLSTNSTIITENQSNLNFTIIPLKNKFKLNNSYFFFDNKILDYNCSKKTAIKPENISCYYYDKLNKGYHNIKVCYNKICKEKIIKKYDLVYEILKVIDGQYLNGVNFDSNNIEQLKYLDSNYFVLNDSNASFIINTTKNNCDYYLNSSLNITLNGMTGLNCIRIIVYNDNSVKLNKTYDATTKIFQNVSLNLNKSINVKIYKYQTKDINIDFLGFDVYYGTIS